jgi:hypothetical protein
MIQRLPHERNSNISDVLGAADESARAHPRSESPSSDQYQSRHTTRQKKIANLAQADLETTVWRKAGASDSPATTNAA